MAADRIRGAAQDAPRDRTPADTGDVEEEGDREERQQIDGTSFAWGALHGFCRPKRTGREDVAEPMRRQAIDESSIRRLNLTSVVGPGR